MLLQSALVWLIVAVVIAWFVRDEKRLARERLDAQARFFATAPKYRHVSVSDL